MFTLEEFKLAWKYYRYKTLFLCLSILIGVIGFVLALTFKMRFGIVLMMTASILSMTSILIKK